MGSYLAIATIETCPVPAELIDREIEYGECAERYNNGYGDDSTLFFLRPPREKSSYHYAYLSLTVLHSHPASSAIPSGTFLDPPA